FELVPLQEHLGERLAEPSEEYIWEHAERIVRDEIDAKYASQLVAQCGRALGEAVHDLLLVAEQCRDALDDLQQHGAESWIFGAIRHHLASTRHGRCSTNETDATRDSKVLAWRGMATLNIRNVPDEVVKVLK